MDGMTPDRQLVFLLDESPETCTPQIRGGKGAGLGVLSRLGLPVPPGLCVATLVSRHAMVHAGELPEGLTAQLRAAMGRVEERTGKRFGDPENPLLVSVRSGAEVSMPGMMDTILNLGINDAIAEGIARNRGGRFAYDCYRRFLTMYGSIVCKVEERLFEGAPSTSDTCRRFRELIAKTTGTPVPEDPWEQLDRAVRAVIESWRNPRAVTYRRINGITDTLGTAITIQEMVYGNLDDRSCSGVVFSRNVATGAPGLYGEFLPCAQGEDVVAGTHSPLPISAMEQWNGAVYRQLRESVELLERHYKAIVDVEFTVEDDVLHLLQCRAAQTSPEATATFAVHEVCRKRMTRDRAVALLSPKQSDLLAGRASLLESAVEEAVASGRTAMGQPASPGVAVGIAALTPTRAEELARQGERVILVRRDTDPDDLSGMVVAKGILTATGGTTCHAAVVARDLGVPAVVGMSCRLESLAVFEAIREGDYVSLDGATGLVALDRLPIRQPEMTRELRLFHWWANRKRHRDRKPKLDSKWAQSVYGANRILCDVYLSDAMASASASSPLGVEANDLRIEVHHSAAKIFAVYLTLAVAVELNQSSAYGASLHRAPEAAEKLFSEYRAFLGSTQALQFLSRLEAMPREKQIEFFALSSEVFSRGYFEPGFGGRPWGVISETVQHFLEGQMSHTILVDHVFDLQHHGRKMFDKHPMLCNPLTNEELLQKQLSNKRNATTIEDLYATVCVPAVGLGAEFGPSEAVSAFWEKGRAAGLWRGPETAGSGGGDAR